ncbi:MAG: OmpA family protein [Polyangiaceae bacterium]|nr:OmpA family protein [Polyangiaceae bacterium]
MASVLRSARPAPAVRPPPPPREEEVPTPVHFELSLVDEFGTALSGAAADFLFRHSGAEEAKTADGSGTARLDKPEGSSFAFARLADEAAVEVLRAVLVPLWNQPRRVQDRRDEVIDEEANATSIVFFRSAPPPEPGTPPVPSPLLTREYQLVAGEPHRVSVQCHVELARLRGFYFDTAKCFLLPTAVPDLTTIIDVYERNRGAALLVVGHTDTSGEEAYNETLSLERADSLAAYLQDRVEDWMVWYGWDKPDAKRWGAHEDSLMLGSLVGRGLVAGPSPVLAYQQWHNALPDAERAKNFEVLAEDGAIGPETRAQLIGDYMRHDRTSLPPDVTLTTHGCGEYFPLDPTLEAIDQNPENPARDQTDRRVEVFFFDGALGVQPPPPDKISKRGSPEYPEWRARARQTVLAEQTGQTSVVVAWANDVVELTPDDLVLTMTSPGLAPAERTKSDARAADGFLRFDFPVEFLGVPTTLSATAEGRTVLLLVDRVLTSMNADPIWDANLTELVEHLPVA